MNTVGKSETIYFEYAASIDPTENIILNVTQITGCVYVYPSFSKYMSIQTINCIWWCIIISSNWLSGWFIFGISCIYCDDSICNTASYINTCTMLYLSNVSNISNKLLPNRPSNSS